MSLALLPLMSSFKTFGSGLLEEQYLLADVLFCFSIAFAIITVWFYKNLDYRIFAISYILFWLRNYFILSCFKHHYLQPSFFCFSIATKTKFCIALIFSPNKLVWHIRGGRIVNNKFFGQVCNQINLFVFYRIHIKIKDVHKFFHLHFICIR